MSNEVLETFLQNVKDHILTVNLDNDLYRDITIARPGCSSYHYNITTRPGYLFITGDMGSFTFSRVSDMFKFFRSETDKYEVNRWYWEEKLVAACHRGGAKKFDCDKVYSTLKEYLSNFIEDEEDSEKIQEAMDAVADFHRYTEQSEWAYVHAINDWDSSVAGGMELYDFWDSRPESLTYHYEWVCYAIVHAIKLYDEYKQNQ